MAAPIRLAVSVLVLTMVLSGAALARSFYNPRRYHSTRQSLTNRTITKRLGRTSKAKSTKPTRKATTRPVPRTKKPAGKR